MTTWTCRDGRQVTIEDRDSMRDEHLLDTVAAVCEGRVRASWDQASAVVRALDDRGLLPVAYNQEISVPNILDSVMRFLRIAVDQRLGRSTPLPRADPLRAFLVPLDVSRMLIGPEDRYVPAEEPPENPEPRREKPYTYKRKIDV